MSRENMTVADFASIPTPDPASFRAQFPVFERLSYLNAGTEGPVPSGAAEAVHRRIELEANEGRCGRPYFEALMELAERLRAAYADVLGCGRSAVARWAAMSTRPRDRSGCAGRREAAVYSCARSGSRSC